MEIREILLICLPVWNLIVFLIYAADKRRARRKQRRISEAALLTLSFAGGGAGAFIGMYLVRHKTRHLKFIILVPASLILQGASVWYFFCKS